MDSTNQVMESRLDLLAITGQADPYTQYAKLRRSQPVCQCDPGGIWIITRYEDVRFALKRTELFSSTGFKEMYQVPWLPAACQRDPFILGQDPPIHGMYRPLVNKAFVTHIINALEPIMRKTANDLAERLRGRGEVDFISDFGYPYAAYIIGNLTGIAETQDVGELQNWLELMEAVTSQQPDDAFVAAATEAILQQNAFFDEVIRDRQQSPRADIVTALIRSEVNGRRLDAFELRSSLDLLTTAGLGTVNYTLSNSILRLAMYPELFSVLKQEPALIPKFIEEILRIDTATHWLLRKTTQAVAIEGTLMPANSLVAVGIASANHDENYFPEPEEFRMDRDNVRDHVAFGYGPHACIGSALARMELKIAIEAITQKFDRITWNEKPLMWITSLTTHSFRHLPVAFL